VFGTKERQANTNPEALWLMLFSYDAKSAEGALVQVPAHTAAEIPGRGLSSLSASYASGGVPLLLVSLENMIGIPIDRYLELSDRDARVLFSATGPLTVDVPEEVRVPAGHKRVRIVFSSGSQRLSSPFLAKLLYTRGVDADDIEFEARHLAFWDAFFDTFDNDPAALSKAIQEAGPALAESDADVDELAGFFRSLAELQRVSLTLTSLPVRPVAAGRDEIYSTDTEELRSFVGATFGEVGQPQDEVRVQVLNGNGVPGIGQKVAELLIGRGFRVILSGNARRLDYGKTLIVTYDRTDKGLALAERAKELLGVGQVQVSAQQQGIVDLTIVIGKDFLSTL
jgi:polyisoprenyl-teichoic acid--peptidoglycan teichoic acid transferase